MQNLNSANWQLIKRVSKGKSAKQAVNEMQAEGILPSQEVLEANSQAADSSSSSGED